MIRSAIKKVEASGTFLRRMPFVFLAAVTLALILISTFGTIRDYSSWWMISLWTLTAFSGCITLASQKSGRKFHTTLLHFSLLLIAAGALVTHLTSEQGTLHLRFDEVTRHFTTDDNKRVELPFNAVITDVDVEYYPGTSTPMDYKAEVKLGDTAPQQISLNHIVSGEGYRLVLSSYDSDMHGATFHVARDAAGTAISYAGYLIFAIAAIISLCVSSGGFRTALRRLRAIPAILIVAVWLPSSTSAAANSTERLPSLPASTSQSLSRLPVFYNDRIAPFGSLELDFANGLTGNSGYLDYSPEQITEGFLFYFGSWKEIPVIKVESPEVRQQLGLTSGENASYIQWFDAVTSGRLSEETLARSGDEKKRRDLARFESVNSLVSGSTLRLFPIRDDAGKVKWFSPTDQDIPYSTETSLWLFIRKSPGYLNECILSGNYAEADKVIVKIALYQKKCAPEAIPSPRRITSELFYNKIARPFIPALLGITAALILMILTFRKNFRRRMVTLLIASGLWGWISLLEILRWIVTGHIPLTNGFETMQFMAWCCFATAVVLAWYRSIAYSFAILAGSLALLVASMSSRGAVVEPLMPVLSSPLLSIHVMLVMGAYALMTIMTVAAITGLLSDKKTSSKIAALEQTLLYPAIFLIGTGIFAGAVWANMSWGRYWGWDPKEVWALVTMLTYSFATHRITLNYFNRPKIMHVFSIAAFLTVLFTYFGVNYLLKGLHSYV